MQQTLHLANLQSSFKAMIPCGVEKRIRDGFESLSPGMRKVGRYVLEHPEDVALLSMREQSRRAGVPPATMTRFAQRLGYTGYDEVRGLFANSMRGRVSDFGQRAGTLAARREELGEWKLAASVVEALADGVAAIGDETRLAGIVDTAALLSSADRILCLGHRSCYAPAYHFAYVAALNGVPTVLLDAPGGIGIDAVNTTGSGDALLAVSFSPYTRQTVEIATSVNELGIPIVALTDSPVSPLARIADQSVSIPTDVAHATYVTAPIFAVAEVLAALVVASSGPEGRRILERNEAELARRNVYWADDEGAPAI